MNIHPNRVLYVDLSRRIFREDRLSADLVTNYIGGPGFGARILYDEMHPGIDPLGADNVLVFVAGPLAGTKVQSFARWKVFFKSPLTGGYFKSSGGGYLAPEMKAAGFEVIVIRGVADRPSYLWVHDGQYALRDARYLWGLDCDDTHLLIRQELNDPNIRLACIGVAGENQVRYAGIFSDRRTAARGGGGAVMGAKNLKALACRGTGKIQLADPESFNAAVKLQVTRYRQDPHYEVFSQRGTQNPEFTNLLGMFPTRNFRHGVMKGWQKLESSQYHPLRIRKTRCSRCMLHCGSLSRVKEGKYAGIWSEGPEYETIWAFTGTIDCPDIGLTIAADKSCDDFGLDSISTGAVIGFAYELFEKGLIDRRDTDGLELVYGNPDPVLPLIEKIAHRRGIGDWLALGTRAAAQKMGRGAEAFAMQVTGLEIPGYDPRGAKAHGLNMMTVPIGADHCSGYAHQELFGAPFQGRAIDRFAVAGKGRLTKYNQDIRALYHFGIMCNFASRYMTPELLARFLFSATGIAEFRDPAYLWLAAERVFNLERMFNAREGFGRPDDVFPARLTEEGLDFGAFGSQRFEAEIMLNEYYQERGWNPSTGNPTPETLSRLGLSHTVS